MTTDGASGAKRGLRGRWLVGGIVLIVLAILAGVLLSTAPSRAATTAQQTVAVTRGSITARVDGSGTVAAAQSLDLNFQSSGTVTEVLVEEGDMIEAGQPLARIDTRDLQAQVDSAQANLNSAIAQLEQAAQGNATPQEIAAQEASVRNAQANLEKTRTNGVTAADIASDEANLRSAQARLDALKNPSQAEISSAELKVRQAEIDVQNTRDTQSKNKTQAELQMQQAVDALTKAQAAYGEAKYNWEYVQETGNSPTTPETTNAQGESVDNKLSEGQRQQYATAFVQAEASLRTAELDVKNAQVAYDNARQSEVSQVQNAEAVLADAQKQLEALRNPTASDLAEAQASVDQARAQLQKTRQGGTKADIAAAQASVDQARANLEQLTAPATETDLQVRQAAVDQAEQSLKQAQIALENATLTAPFSGVISAVNIVPGSSVGSGTTAPITLINRNPLHVDMSLSENDVAKVQADQPVTLTIDALADWTAEGTVSYIAPAATESNGVVTYKVRVDFPDSDERVKVGMTANISIVTATKENVLLVPSTALLPKGTGQVVQVPNEQTGQQQPTEIDVQTGLSDGTYTEIVSGLSEGQQILAAPSEQTQAGPGGPFGGN